MRLNCRSKWTERWALFCVVLILGTASAVGEEQLVSVVVDRSLGPAASHGLQKLIAAVRAKGIECEQVTSLDDARGAWRLAVGLAGSEGPASELLSRGGHPIPHSPEALVIQRADWEGKPVWVIAGSDDQGLMYGELDVSERIGWSTDPGSLLSDVRETVDKPAVTTRAISVYTMNRAYWESRFYDEAYWERYFDMLAQNRFNSFVVIFGYENGGFLAPAYPYFFDLPSFPEVRMIGITSDQQQRNLVALNRLIDMAHNRGVEVTVGFWDHIYRGGVQGGGIPGADRATQAPVPGLVWGVTAENLIPYTQAALAAFIQHVPKLDGIQFRMHDESGLKKSEQEGFWRGVFQMVKQKSPNLRFDLRAKGLPDAVIQSAFDTGVKFRITTKYWMEQMGMPFHPTHINRQNQFDRRHSYADLLRYPQRYSMHWRLWNGGTARVLLWGDPDYARRFAESTHLYDGDGFEVNEPLCTKMEAQPHDAAPFRLLQSQHRYYDYEFERYWHFFQVFGRIGYDPACPSEVWLREFERRFGKEAGPFVAQGLHRASQVLPRIVAACYPYGSFPMTRGWAEKQRLGDLPAYANAEGSDIQQFASFDEEAELLIAGGETAKVRPPQTSLWFEQQAAEILTRVRDAEENVGDRRSKEFESTLADLRILSHLALYHARRIPAAVSYCIFERTQDVTSLDQAIAYEREAIAAWRQLVSAAADFYSDDLMMGVRGADLCGHWKDELTALENGLAVLQRQRQELPATGRDTSPPQYRAAAEDPGSHPPSVIHQPVVAAVPNQPLSITAQVVDPSGVKWVRLRYRSVNQHQDFQTIPMLPTANTDQYQAVIPSEQVQPEWDLMYLIEVMNSQGNGAIYPDLNQTTPYVVVKLER